MATSSGAARVLIVDDDEDACLLMTHVLHDLVPNVEFITASTGEDALILLDQMDVALMIADQRMPGMDGLELLRRAHDKQPDLPAIMVTGFPDLDVARSALNDGHVIRFYLKPAPPQELAEAVQEAMLMTQLS